MTADVTARLYHRRRNARTGAIVILVAMAAIIASALVSRWKTPELPAICRGLSLDAKAGLRHRCAAHAYARACAGSDGLATACYYLRASAQMHPDDPEIAVLAARWAP